MRARVLSRHGSSVVFSLVMIGAMSWGTSCRRAAVEKESVGSDSLVEESVASESSPPVTEQFSGLYALYRVHLFDDESFMEHCVAEDPVEQIARPIACWSSTRGFLKDTAPCSTEGTKVHAREITYSAPLGPMAKSCDHNHDAIEGYHLKELSPEGSWEALLATREEALLPPEQCTSHTIEDVADLPFEMTFTPENLAPLIASFDASEVPLPECVQRMRGKTLKELVAEKSIRINDAYMEVDLDEDDERELLLPLFNMERECGIHMYWLRDNEEWSLAAFNANEHELKGALGYSYYFTTEMCTDLDGDGGAELWMGIGGESERSNHFLRLEDGVLREVGMSHYYGS